MNLTRLSLIKGAILLMFFSIGLESSAQTCNPIWDRTKSSNCENLQIFFIANAPNNTTFEWDFGDGSTSGIGTSPLYRNPSHTYRKAGLYIVNFKSSGGTGGACTDTVMVLIKESPVVKTTLLSPVQQCFTGNRFCFVDNSKAVQNPAPSSLVAVRYLFSDGGLYVVPNPTGNDTICHTSISPDGGWLDLTIEAEDVNGCKTKVVYNKYIRVFPKLTVKYQSNNPSTCNLTDTARITNLTDTFTKLKDIARFVWDFGNPGTLNNIVQGDSVTNTQWYTGTNNNRLIKRRYDISSSTSGRYDFMSKLTVTTKYGCTESFTLNNTVTLSKINARISSSTDSGCMANSKVTYMLKDISTGASIVANSAQWNFGDPGSGPFNTQNGTTNNVTHEYGIGAYMVSLKLAMGPCSVTLFDTITLSGPLSQIEVLNSRIPENEKYQCVIRDSVHFTNNSLFYHNDPIRRFEDSTLNGKTYVFAYPGNQAAVPSKVTSKPQRNKGHVLRLWDFGDSYAPKCTTDTKKNKNVGLNCRYSLDSLPVHWYTPWEDIYTYYNNSQYNATPAERLLACKGGKYCYKANYYRQPSLTIPADTIVIIPRDSTFKYAGRTITPATKETFAGSFRIKKVTTKYKGEAIYTPTLSDETWVFYTKGLINIKNIITGNKYTRGAGSWTLKKGDQFELKKGDSAILKPQVWITAGKTITALPTMACIDTIIGERDTFIQRSRVFIDSNFHRNNFYLRYEKAYTATLSHQDTLSALRCKSVSEISIALVKPNADGLSFEGIKCYAPPSPPYGMTFKLDHTKPGTTQRLLKVNFDSTQGKNNWVTHSGLLKPPVPGNAPWHTGYQNSGAYPNSFVKAYSAGDIQNKNPGWVTLGLIIGNGRLISGGVPECMDTTWYHNAFRYLYLDSRFEIIHPEKNQKSLCVGDTFTFRLIDPKMDSIISLVWNWNDNEGTYYEELGFFNQPYPGPNAKRNDNSIKDWKKGDKWLYNYVIRQDYNGVSYKILDTIVTSITRKWAITANVMENNGVLNELFAPFGLDIIKIPADQIGLYLGNGTGKGCIDTTGYGKLIKFGISPYRDALTFKRGTTWYRYTDTKKKDSTIISQTLHFRDSSRIGFETLKQSTVNKYSGLKVTPGVYRHVYKEANRYFPSLTIRNTSGCFQPRNVEVNVGFSWHWSYSDTVLCGGGSNVVVLKDSIRYFAYEDPFQWLNSKDYWKNQTRFLQQRETKKIDFNDKDDADPTKRFNVTGIGVPSFSWQYDVPGEYTIRIAMKDSMGCKDTARQKIVVTGAVAGFKLSNQPCQTLVSFNDTSRITDPCMKTKGKPCDEFIDYDWIFGDGTMKSKLKNPVHKYVKTGYYNVVLKVRTKLGCVDSITKKIFVGGPQPFFTKNKDTALCINTDFTFTNQSLDPLYSPKWIWNFGDGTTLSDSGNRKSVVHRYTKPGIYNVYLTQTDQYPGSTARCAAIYPDTSAFQQAKVTVKVVKCGKVPAYVKTNLFIFPNPAIDEIFIKPLTGGEIVIYDVSGKEMQREKITTNQSIHISRLSKGTYFIKYSEGSTIYNGMFIKQ